MDRFNSAYNNFKIMKKKYGLNLDVAQPPNYFKSMLNDAIV